MTTYLLECPCPCGVRFPVDSETMRVVGTPTRPVEVHGPQPVTVEDWPVVHLGRPDPAGGSQ